MIWTHQICSFLTQQIKIPADAMLKACTVGCLSWDALYSTVICLVNIRVSHNLHITTDVRVSFVVYMAHIFSILHKHYDVVSRWCIETLITVSKQVHEIAFVTLIFQSKVFKINSFSEKETWGTWVVFLYFFKLCQD